MEKTRLTVGEFNAVIWVQRTHKLFACLALDLYDHIRKTELDDDKYLVEYFPYQIVQPKDKFVHDVSERWLTDERNLKSFDWIESGNDGLHPRPQQYIEMYLAKGTKPLDYYLSEEGQDYLANLYRELKQKDTGNNTGRYELLANGKAKLLSRSPQSELYHLIYEASQLSLWQGYTLLVGTA